ncbi:MAG: hypothetical protein BVN29_01640 [Nitrospira sp. ST-bin5]|nr:MAG: hypothetical protein BVN29_01640 [Nitrospira sp. ST-bin5]
MTIQPRTFIRSIVGVVSLMALCLAFALGTSAGQTAKTVQYRTITMPFPPATALLQSKLEEFGAEGWELVFVIQQSGTLIFKRSQS